MHINKINCDNCQQDIDPEAHVPTNHLQLRNISTANTSNVVYAVMVYPHIDRFMDFCNVKCLKEWVNKK